MSWLVRYRVRHYLENSIYFFPIAAIVLALLTIRVLHLVDGWIGWSAGFHPDSARAVLGMLAGATFTCVVFISSTLLLVLQLASAQLTPRIVGAMFRDAATKLALTLFAFTFTLSAAALLRVGDTVPRLTMHVATYGCVVGLAMLLYLVEHIGKALRPSGALRRVVRAGRDVIHGVYKRPLDESDEVARNTSDVAVGEASLTFTSASEGVVLAVDITGLVELAAWADCLIQIVPQVGDFVAAGDPIFRVFGGRSKVPPDALRDSIVLGQERTLEQDPTLAFRIMVDIACKALSSAINDPTTAVLAIDQIHHLLRTVAGRTLNDGWVRDTTGALRVVYPRPTWEDYVNLAATEIRQFGRTSIQVVRRLRAMLTDLVQTVPDFRAAPLRRQLDLLDSTCESSFAEPEDREMANGSDLQGVGGSERTDEAVGLESAALFELRSSSVREPQPAADARG